MTRKYWGILSGVALVFSLQNSFAGEAWLVITSDPSGAAVFVDGTYRGATPQRHTRQLKPYLFDISQILLSPCAWQ